jgi:hypothetical protein
MLHAYLQLRERTDRFVKSVTARYQEQIVCRAGCNECCQAGLTVVMVEAIAIGRGLDISDERIFLQAGQKPLFSEGKCAFLDEKGHCSVYINRPLVCRTQGMPLLMAGSDEVSICRFNLIGMAPHRSAVLNTENLESALFAANLDYCQKNGLYPLSRVPLDRLAQLAGFIKFSDAPFSDF